MKPESQAAVQQFIVKQLNALKEIGKSHRKEYSNILEHLALEVRSKLGQGGAAADLQQNKTLSYVMMSEKVSDLLMLISNPQQSKMEGSISTQGDVNEVLRLVQTELDNYIAQEKNEPEESSTAKSLSQLSSASAAAPASAASSAQSVFPDPGTTKEVYLSFLMFGGSEAEGTMLASKFATPVLNQKGKYQKELNLEDRTIRLSITVQDNRTLAVRYPEGQIVAFDLNDRASFEGLKQIYIHNIHEAPNLGFGRIPRWALVGCKADLKNSEGAIPSDEVRKWANDIGFEYFETSENDIASIENVFHSLIRQCLVDYYTAVENLQQHPNHLSLNKYRMSLSDYEGDFERVFSASKQQPKIDKHLIQSLHGFREAAWKQATSEVEKLDSFDKKIVFLKSMQRMPIFSRELASFVERITPGKTHVQQLQSRIGQLLQECEKQKIEEPQASHTEST